MEAITLLSENKKMPLVLATASQLQSSPKSLGSIEPNASMGDLISKVGALESCLSKFMETNSKQMVAVEEEVKRLSKKEVPVVNIDPPPSAKKRKMAVRSEHNRNSSSSENSENSEGSRPRLYAESAVSGINQLSSPPLPQAADPGKFEELMKNIMKPRGSPRNTLL